VNSGRAILASFARWFDPRGRSTRTELLGFCLLYCALIIPFALASALFGMAFPGRGWPVWAFQGLVLLVWLPLCMRRLHDSGRSAAGLLAALPALASAFYDMAAQEPWHASHRPWWLQAMLAAATLYFLALLLWKPEEGANRYGPNPRGGGSDEAQLA